MRSGSFARCVSKRELGDERSCPSLRIELVRTGQSFRALRMTWWRAIKMVPADQNAAATKADPRSVCSLSAAAPRYRTLRAGFRLYQSSRKLFNAIHHRSSNGGRDIGAGRFPSNREPMGPRFRGCRSLTDETVSQIPAFVDAGAGKRRSLLTHVVNLTANLSEPAACRPETAAAVR